MKKIVLSGRARRKLKKLDPQIAYKIIEAIETLPALCRHAALTGKLTGCYKFRVDDWRIIYMMDGDEIKVLNIGNRKDIYAKTASMNIGGLR